MTLRTTRGITVIEVAIGLGIVSLVLVFSMHAIGQFINTGKTIGEKTVGLLLAEEGLEMLRYLRDEDWNTIATIPTNTTRYLSVSTSAISVTTTPETVGRFTRSFIMSNVYRNSSTDDIVASTTGGSVADSESKYVTVTVMSSLPTTTISLSTIITNIDP